MAGNDNSPWHGLDKRVSITEARLDFHEAELKKMTAALSSIAEKVDENTAQNKTMADAITRSILEHERREEDKARQRHTEQRRLDISSRRWTIGTALSLAVSIIGWLLHSQGIL
jgi:Asp-tRNA(Asn)/Glu-tRNA(Gln) amidotransferase C subunit